MDLIEVFAPTGFRVRITEGGLLKSICLLESGKTDSSGLLKSEKKKKERDYFCAWCQCSNSILLHVAVPAPLIEETFFSQ